MNTVLYISLLLLVLAWFLLVDYPMLFGVFVPTGATSRRTFKWIVIVVLLLSILFFGEGDIAHNIASNYITAQPFGVMSGFAVLFSALLTLVVLERFELSVSVCYAILGAFEGYRLSTIEGSQFNFAMAGSWVAAPVVSLIFGVALYLIYKAVFGHSHIHFIKLSYYMRYAVIAGVALGALAVGINYCGLLVGLFGAVFGSATVFAGIIPALAVAATLLLFGPFVRRRADICAERYFDFTTQTLVAVGLSVAATLLLFSFDSVCGLIGLQSSPLSVVTLVFGAQAGVGLAQRHESVERETILKTGFGLILTPIMSLLLTTLILFLSKANGSVVNDGTDMSIIAFAALLLVAVAFFGYVRNQQRQKAKIARLVYSQQQQLYENQRALNDMELKTILSENQSLHQTLEMKRKEIVNVALSISEQKEFLESLNRTVRELTVTDSSTERSRLIKQLDRSLSQRLSFDQEIDTFYTQAEMLHKDFSVKLTEGFPNLTLQERRLATLLRLGFSSKYIATLMNITPKSVEINRYRLRQKLGLKTGDNLINFIKSI
ncbi:MAG: LuxR C-terminal-related transcriptional regulator [Tidjanibacter sp.]|nr:LuxR C-terminal-related transcriptional regulator [Tidjanibacter sp.]